MSTTDFFPELSLRIENRHQDLTRLDLFPDENVGGHKSWTFHNERGEVWRADAVYDHLFITGRCFPMELCLKVEDMRRELAMIMGLLGGTSSHGPASIRDRQDLREAFPGVNTERSQTNPKAVAWIIFEDSEVVWLASVMMSMLAGLPRARRGPRWETVGRGVEAIKPSHEVEPPSTAMSN